MWTTDRIYQNAYMKLFHRKGRVTWLTANVPPTWNDFAKWHDHNWQLIVCLLDAVLFNLYQYFIACKNMFINSCTGKNRLPQERARVLHIALAKHAGAHLFPLLDFGMKNCYKRLFREKMRKRQDVCMRAFDWISRCTSWMIIHLAYTCAFYRRREIN